MRITTRDQLYQRAAWERTNEEHRKAREKEERDRAEASRKRLDDQRKQYWVDRRATVFDRLLSNGVERRDAERIAAEAIGREQSALAGDDLVRRELIDLGIYGHIPERRDRPTRPERTPDLPPAREFTSGEVTDELHRLYGNRGPGPYFGSPPTDLAETVTDGEATITEVVTSLRRLLGISV